MKNLLTLLLIISVHIVSGQMYLYGSSTIKKAPLFKQITADASATPTNSQIVISNGNNAVELYTQYGLVTRPNFNLYIKHGASSTKATQSYRLNRWQYKVSAGDTIKIGCDSAIPFKIVQYHDNLTRGAPSGATGTVYTDTVAPMSWIPVGAHIILPTTNSAFTIAHTGTATTIFIQEFDGNTWSGVAYYTLEASRDLTISAVCKRIALGTYSGQSFTVTGPVGTTFNTSNYDRRFFLPNYTGTLFIDSTWAQLDSSFAQCKAGDRIQLKSYGIDTIRFLSSPVYRVNSQNGHTGLAGVQLIGFSSDRSHIVLVPNDSLSASWTINNGSDTATTYFENFTVSCVNTSEGVSVFSGNWKWKNVRGVGVFHNGSGGNGDIFPIGMDAGNDPINFYAVDCQADSAYADCWNFSANSGTPWSQINLSSIVLVNCGSVHPGAFSNAQCLTSHFNLPYTVSGGTYSDAFLDIVADQNNNATFGYLEFVTVTPGTRDAEIQYGSMFGCNLTLNTSSSLVPIQSTTGGYYFNNIQYQPSASSATLIRNQNFTNINHNIITWISGSGSRAVFYSSSSGTPSLTGNIFIGFPTAINHTGSVANNTAVISLFGNDFISNTTALNVADTSNRLIFGNIATKSNTTTITIGTSAKYTSDGYNVFTSVTGSYTPGTNDITNASASLDANYMPVVSGNCDAGQGQNSLYNFIGDRDPYGLVFIYDTNYTPIGARSRPVIYSGSLILPDAY